MTPRLGLVGGLLTAALALGCGSDDSSTPASGGSGGMAGQAGAAGSGGAIGGPLSLEPGEVAELTTAEGKAGVVLATPEGTEQYVLILASTQLDASDDTYAYSLAFDSAPSDAKPQLVTGCSLTADEWKSKTVTPETPPTGAGAKQGDKKNIGLAFPGGSETIEVEAVAVGAQAVVWADITPAHPAVLDSAVVQEFLTDFEKTILPRARAIFGVESDQDQDGHIQLVFSPLTYKTAVAFFTSCDLAPSIYCPQANGGEYLYLTPPNAIDPPYNTPNAIKEILAHELSHMIHYNRKVLKNATSGWVESAYMGEGIGALAQDVLGYQSGNLYVTKAGLDQIGAYSLGETLVDNVEYDLTRDGALRGGSYLFVRWFYDRAGGDVAATDGSVANAGGIALLRTLLDAPESISAKLPEVAKTTTADIAVDFWTTLAMSNRDEVGGPAPKNACFAYLPTVTDPVTGRQRGANVFASFHGQQMEGPKLQLASEADGSVSAGGGELIQIDATSGVAELPLTVTVDTAALPRVRIGRIR